MSTTEAAYLAGLIDGEGGIGIYDRRPTRPASSRPTIILSVAGTCTAMHKWVVNVTAVGTTSLAGPEPGSVSSQGIRANRQCYSWRVTSTAAYEILRQIAPYMIEKRVRAERALACYASGYDVFDALESGDPLPVG